MAKNEKISISISKLLTILRLNVLINLALIKSVFLI